MKPLRIFGIGRNKLLEKGCTVPAKVTDVQISRLYVIKKPVRIGITPENTLFSHYIIFRYTVDAVPYQGRLFVPLTERCPQRGESIEVYYDPEKPQNYACRSFGPAPRPIGW